MTDSLENDKVENLFRTIIKIVKNINDIDKTKNTITEIVCKKLNADRCIIVDYDKKNDKFLPIQNEFLSSGEISSLKGFDPEKYLPDFTRLIKKKATIIVENRKVIHPTNKKNYELEQSMLEKYGINSIIVVPLLYDKELLGFLSVHHLDKEYSITKSEINVIKDISNQIVVAIDKANLYKINQIQVKRAELLQKIVEASTKSIILDDVLSEITRTIVNLFGIPRVTIGKISKDDYDETVITGEYMSDTSIKSFKSEPLFDEAIEYWRQYLTNGGKTKIIEDINSSSDLPENIIKIYNNLKVKSYACIPLGIDDFVWGGIFLSEYKTNGNIIQENLEFLENLASQIYMAIRQAELYKKKKKALERETLLKNITEIIRNTIDLDIVKKSIVNEIGEKLNADRCFIIEYDQNTGTFLPVSTEYTNSTDIKSTTGMNIENETPEIALQNLQNHGVIITNLDKYLSVNNLFNTPSEEHFKKYMVKSGFSIPIFHRDKSLGLLVIHYINREGTFIEEEVGLVKSLAAQIGIAINQAKLYENEKKLKEQEKMGITLIENLRKYMDKKMISKIFVKHIQKFFNADIVYFAEYDPVKETYLPVDKDAEELSNYKEKSFINFDWNSTEGLEYIKQLTEKQELIISSLEEYRDSNKANNKFLNLLTSANIKSSYTFSVRHYKNLLGVLSINFTGNINILSENDINRIKNICTQVGIALYQSELYLKAKQCSFSKLELLETISVIVERHIKSILYEITHLSKNETEQTIQINNIIENCNQITCSTKNYPLD